MMMMLMIYGNPKVANLEKKTNDKQRKQRVTTKGHIPGAR